ncbi:hypothetical protein CcCBS67573_g01952 [Chytriomyces confervae]|uniref:SYO1-like TPR repeats domain-containing protein n=1 Tax=Chytriomyces confervae TaxID=246404 RepID=A0A507FP36_9FUNG|nr:hypothetical protein CcCBS67573_g01952 [Chytriomyces confervae]
MGKHNNRPPRKHHKSARANPIYGSENGAADQPAAEPVEEVVSSNLNEIMKDQIVPIIKKLQSEKKDERSWAAAAVSSLILDAESRVKLLKGGIIPVLMAGLAPIQGETDQETDTTLVDIAGAVSNLASFGGEEVCAELERRGCVPAVSALLPLTKDALERALAGNTKDGDVPMLALFEQCVSILWAICESSDAAFSSVTSSIGGVLVDMLVHIIASTSPSFTVPASLIVVSAQCLNTLTEGNPKLHPYFPSHHITSLTAVAQAKQLPHPVSNDKNTSAYIRILSTSILCNINPLPTSQLAAIVCATLDRVDLPALASEVSGAAEKGVTKEGQLTSSAERTLDTANTCVGSMQLALELLANAYSEDYEGGAENGGMDEEWDDGAADVGMMEQDGDEDEELGENADDEPEAFDEMMEDEDLAATMAKESGALGAADLEEGAEAAAATIADRVSVLVKFNLIERMLNLAATAGAASAVFSSIGSESSFTGVVGLVNAVKVRAFGCLHNILTCLGAEEKGKWYEASNSQTVIAIWNMLFEVANKAAATAAGSDNAATLEFIEAAVSAIWALARGVDGVKGSNKIILNPTVDQINNLIGSSSLPNAPASLKLKCVSALGILAKTPSVNATVGPFLVSCAVLDSTPLEVTSEALNAIYDVYSDAAFEYDGPVFVKGGFNKKLKEAYPRIKSRVKALDKRRFREIRERADEAVLNLGAFIKYKEDEARASKK